MNKTSIPIIRLSYAPGEHLISAWARYNLRAGFAYISFDQSLKYWDLPKQHLKPQRVYDKVQRTITALSTSSDDDFHEVLMKRTVSNLWRLSLSGTEKLEEADFTRSNIEHNAFAFTAGWKFCCQCIHADNNKYGFSYWHRNHQLPSLTHCVIHKCVLTTSDELSHLSKLNLPSMVCEQRFVVASDHIDLRNWSNFLSVVDSLIEENPNLIDRWKEQIAIELKVNVKASSRKKEIYKGWQTLFEKEVGTVILAHLFKSYHKNYSRKMNILWATLSGDNNVNGVRHPVYWLVIMYWLRKQLLHLEDADYAHL